MTVHLTPLSRTFITLFVIGSVLWFGASVARFVIAYDVYIPGTTEMKVGQTEEARLVTVWLYTLVGGWTGWSFATAFVGFLGLTLTTMRWWKQEGWLFMSSILFTLIIPAQAWMIWQDYEMWKLFDAGTGTPLAAVSEILAVFSRRMTDVVYSVVNGLTFLSAITIMILGVWRPFRMAPQRSSTVSEPSTPHES
jgi:hypothetical protein